LQALGGGLVVVLGAMIAAWTIRETEEWKRGLREFEREPLRLTVTNALLFSAGGLLFAGLFVSFAPNWTIAAIEVVLGCVVGAGIALMQGRAGGAQAFSSPTSVWQHALAFMLATPITILSMHFGAWQNLPMAIVAGCGGRAMTESSPSTYQLRPAGLYCHRAPDRAAGHILD
jgi:hypothetical protein